MEAVGERMHELLLDVVAKAGLWATIDATAPDGLTREEAFAYEDLIQSVLAFGDAYVGFEQIQSALARADLGDTLT